MYKVICLLLFLPLVISQAKAITLNCEFNEKINAAYANKITCGMDSEVWGGNPFDVCEHPTSLSGEYISRLVLKDDKAQIFREWTVSFINFSIKKNGSPPKRRPYNSGLEVLFYHYHQRERGDDWWNGQHHFVLKSDIDQIFTLFVDERTGQSFLEQSLSFGDDKKNKLSAWTETRLGLCNINS